MFCEHCGKKVEKGVGFCAYCGEGINSQEILHNEQPVDKTKKSRKLNFIKGLLGIAAFFLFFLGARYIVSTYFTSDSLEQALAEASNELNKQTPKTIDSVTELTTTTVSGKELIYHYELSTTESFTQNDLDTLMKDEIVKDVCTNSATKKIIDLGASLTYDYSYNTGGNIGKITVSPTDCK